MKIENLTKNASFDSQARETLGGCGCRWVIKLVRCKIVQYIFGIRVVRWVIKFKLVRICR